MHILDLTHLSMNELQSSFLFFDLQYLIITLPDMIIICVHQKIVCLYLTLAIFIEFILFHKDGFFIT